MRVLIFIIFLSLIFVACTRKPEVLPFVDRPYVLAIPQGFPPISIPEDNQLTVARVELGKRLFYDKQLSRDFSLSCASCHHQQLGFADNSAINFGVNGAAGFRNSPTLANVGYLSALFAEGGIPSLELQAIAPIIEVHELNLDFQTLIQRLSANDEYSRLFDLAYQSPPTSQTIVKALASFERTLISGNSRFDQYYYQNRPEALSPSEINGMNLFFSEELACTNCHSGFLFTNQSMQNIGLYDVYEDEGLARLTLNPEDVGKFKVPTLRNIEVTAPYMHNGSLATLEQVIEHFNQGGVGHANQNEWIKPLNLNETEKADLVNFLKALTDQEFLNNPNFR